MKVLRRSPTYLSQGGRETQSLRVRSVSYCSTGQGDQTLTISGSVNVIRAGGRRERRNLRMALPTPNDKAEKEAEEAAALAVPGNRRAEEAEEGSGGFELVVSLGTTDDSAAAGRFESAAAGLASMGIGAAGAALIV